MYVYIYIYIYIYIFYAQNVEVRGSNPRIPAYLNLKMPFRFSKLPRSGPIFPDLFFENLP